jgi:glycosyltransferase involved in cell wall biosynthesis
MRIGMFSWESLYSIRVGGVAPHVSELSEALAKRGHEVHVFTRRGDFDSYDRINDVHYQRVTVKESGDILTQMDRMSDAMHDRFGAVENIFGRFDIIHGHDWHPVLALARIKSEQAIPLVLTLHSTEWGRCGNNWGNEKISHREWLGGYESSRIIVTSPQMKTEIVRIYSIPGSKIAIIPNGIVSGKIQKDVDAISVKKKYEIEANASMVLFCGRMSYQKAPDLLVGAMPLILKNHKNVKFVFAGEGDTMPFCEDMARRLKVNDACRFLGYISSQAKEELMNSCDLFCVPSRNEPFGMVILEAWDAGKPIVATEAVSIINNFQDGLLAYIQPESIAWCINHLLEHPKEMRKIARAGHKRIKKEFSWDKIAKEIEDMYDDVIAPSAVASIL